ncbi:MAG TPA: hypothetical protein VGR78_09255 [Verrucomicrobiae bacterium]|jgi:hypothetical protein|nr:hypothetical protein [Verrucomicrobiae bacterium]
MRILHLNGEIFDLDQVISQKVESNCVRLTFRNGDEIPLRWRDDRERGDILRAVEQVVVS